MYNNFSLLCKSYFIIIFFYVSGNNLSKKYKIRQIIRSKSRSLPISKLYRSQAMELHIFVYVCIPWKSPFIPPLHDSARYYRRYCHSSRHRKVRVRQQLQHRTTFSAGRFSDRSITVEITLSSAGTSVEDE